MADDALKLTLDLIEEFLAWQVKRKRSGSTIERYRHDLTLLYEWLSPSKMITSDTLVCWKEAMLQGDASARTANSRVSAANSLLNYAGKRDLQLRDFSDIGEEKEEIHLERKEYLRLLQAALDQEDLRGYLLVKVIGTTGISLQTLSALTVADVKAGQIRTESEVIVLPAEVKRELLRYAEKKGMKDGALFASKNGILMNRGAAAAILKRLACAASVEKEKVTPSSLQRMYRETRAEILQSLSYQIEACYADLLQREQHVFGWTENQKIG